METGSERGRDDKTGKQGKKCSTPGLDLLAIAGRAATDREQRRRVDSGGALLAGAGPVGCREFPRTERHGSS